MTLALVKGSTVDRQISRQQSASLTFEKITGCELREEMKHLSLAILLTNDIPFEKKADFSKLFFSGWEIERGRRWSDFRFLDPVRHFSAMNTHCHPSTTLAASTPSYEVLLVFWTPFPAFGKKRLNQNKNSNHSNYLAAEKFKPWPALWHYLCDALMKMNQEEVRTWRPLPHTMEQIEEDGSSPKESRETLQLQAS